MEPHIRILENLANAFDPCKAFESICNCMRWEPKAGHVPRGFCGAISTPDDVRLVLVCAEPGNPHDEENHEADGTPEGHLASACRYVWNCYAENGGRDLFHRKIRRILDLCWPGLDFIEQMRRTWITDSVLCSARAEGGHVPDRIAQECIVRYLEKQLSLFKRPLIVAALGGKAQRRLKRVQRRLELAKKEIEFVPAYAAAPPGCNFRGAEPSWKKIATAVHSHRSKKI